MVFSSPSAKWAKKLLILPQDVVTLLIVVELFKIPRMEGQTRIKVSSYSSSLQSNTGLSNQIGQIPDAGESAASTSKEDSIKIPLQDTM